MEENRTLTKTRMSAGIEGVEENYVGCVVMEGNTRMTTRNICETLRKDKMLG